MMALSQAIRLGAMMRPQGYVRFFSNSGTCALGAALDAYGGHTDDLCTRLYKLFPKLYTRHSQCHECGRTLMGIIEPQGDLVSAIAHLNDDHLWTRERIADWVELEEGIGTETHKMPEMAEAEIGIEEMVGTPG